MAKLGSTVDARLSRISPYAIRAIEMGGAAKGAGYAAVGSSLGKAITSVTTRMRDDKINASLNVALAASMSINPGDGTKTFDRKNFMELAKGTVPPKAAREFADKRFDLVQKENDIIEQQIARALNQSNIEDELDLKEQELTQKKEAEEFRKAQLRTQVIQQGVANTLEGRRIAVEEDALAEDKAERLRKEAEAEAKKLTAQEATERYKTNSLKIRGLNAEFEDPNTTPERLREINKELQKLVFSNEALNPGVLSAAQTLQYGIRQDSRLFEEPELDLDDQINAAANAFYADTTQVALFDQKRADDPQALLATMLTLLNDPNIKTEKLEKLYTLLNQDVRNKAAARKSLGLNGGNPPPAPVTQTSASGNRTYPDNYIWPWFRREDYRGPPTIGETQMGQNLYSFLTPDQDK